MARLVNQLIEINDSRIALRMQSLIKDTSSKWFGGSPDQYGIPNAGSSCALIRDLSCAYVSPRSRYFQSTELLKSMETASQFLLNIQYEDGTVDLHTTNFHSPPDTAFRVEPLALSYHLLSGADPVSEKVLGNLRQFLQQAGQALAVGGIHTPNHRWVVCMALAHIHTLFPDERYLDRVDQWLGEGIDIDPDGQFTEKSTTVYSPIVDRCLITVARLLRKEELFDPVRKNLDMTLYYIRPNYQVSTEASGRQDRYQIGTVAPYYYPYRYMSLKDGNGQFADVAIVIENGVLADISHELIYLLQDPYLLQELPENKPLKEDYVKYFKHSSLVRIRRGDRDATILSENPLVFSYFKGNAALTGLRLAAAFFGKGQFEADSMEIDGNRYILKQFLQGPYYQPLKEGIFEGSQEDFAVQRASREQSEVQKLESVITIEEKSGDFSIGIEIKGTDNVPVALELGFREGGVLQGVTPVADIPDAWLLAQGQLQYSFQGDTISIGPGHAEHQWTQLRGALPKMAGPTVYLTGYTPVNWELNVGPGQTPVPSEHYLLIGTYSTESDPNGIHVYRFNSQNAEFTPVQPVTQLPNASFLAISSDSKNVYAVSEGRDGSVNAYNFNQVTGELGFTNSVPAPGPCYVSVDDGKQLVFVGNYGGGSVQAIHLNDDGSLVTDNFQTVQHEGGSVVKNRQDKPHVHAVVLSAGDRYLMVPDLGTDKVYQYHIDASRSQVLKPAVTPFLQVPAGGGPRHLVFHPNGRFAYLVLELEAAVAVMDYHQADGRLELKQTINMTDPTFQGKVSGADIHVSPDGRFLYASNRGDANEIAIFTIDQLGTLTLAGRQSVLGKTPRNFAIDPTGNFLLAANQNTNEIVIFRRDTSTGLLTVTNKRIPVDKPVCLKFTATGN